MSACTYVWLGASVKWACLCSCVYFFSSKRTYFLEELGQPKLEKEMAGLKKG